MKKLLVLIMILSLWAVSGWAGSCPFPLPVGCPDSEINMDGNTVTGQVTYKSTSSAIAHGPLIIRNDNDGLNSLPGILFQKYGTDGTNLTASSFSHLGGIAFYPYFNNTIGKYAFTFATLIDPTWNYVTNAAYPEAWMHFGTVKDGTGINDTGYAHTFKHGPNGTQSIKHDAVALDLQPDVQMTVHGSSEVYDASTLGSEILTAPTDFSNAAWTKSAAFTNGVYTFAGGATGTLTQVESSTVDSKLFPESSRFVIDIEYAITNCGATTGANLTYVKLSTNTITSAYAEANTLIGTYGEEAVRPSALINEQFTSDCSAGECKRIFQGAVNPSAFTIMIAASGTCTVTFTKASMKEVQGGNLTVAGKIKSRFSENIASPVVCVDTGTGALGALTIAPESSYVEIANFDADGCDITMSKTGQAVGMLTTLCVVYNEGGTVNFADTAGLTQLNGNFAANLDDCIVLRYGSYGRYREQSRSAN